MSEPVQHPAKPPIVRLSTWVNVVLILILFASCGANSGGGGSSPSGTQIANDVVSQLQAGNGAGSPGGLASAAEVEDLCRLLGAIAAREKITPEGVMSSDTMTRCREVAQESATRTTP